MRQPPDRDPAPGGLEQISPWRNDGVWSDRLREDSAILEAQLSRAQDEAIRELVGTKERGGELDLVVVYGSVSRGEQRPDSDLDVYYETGDPAVELEWTDPNLRSHVFGAASGALLESLRRGDEMAFDVVSDALVVYDGGSFRALLVAIDEERLRPREP
jgi:predicted nucleotidyltransferase